MNTLDDLKTLKRLLAEFELPVSPILEYAIQNKEEELMSQSAEDIVKEENPVKSLRVSKDYSDGAKTNKKAPAIMRVYRADGSYIEESKVAYTMIKAIKEIGAERVYEIKIPLDGMYLVTKEANPKYPSAQHDIGNGFFLNVHSNTVTKKRQLEKIFKVLNLNWRVDVII